MLQLLGLVLYSCVGDTKEMDKIIENEIISSDIDLEDIAESLMDVEPEIFIQSKPRKLAEEANTSTSSIDCTNSGKILFSQPSLRDF